MRFDLTDLRLFLLVTESSNITKGAERAGLALASASARIRAMEEELGVPLLERGRRGVQTTPAGGSGFSCPNGGGADGKDARRAGGLRARIKGPCATIGELRGHGRVPA
jgi:hypothetical protein